MKYFHPYFLAIVQFLIVCPSLMADHHAHITGIIYNKETHEPLLGVNIRVKSSGQGTTSDINGNFMLRAETSDTLLISYIGYLDQQIILAGRRTVSIYLEENVELLSETLITGTLGIKRASREVGTANKVIGNDELNQAKVVNPLLGMASKVSGLRINMFDSKVDPDVQVVLRGIRSHNGDNAPLYVVDGVPLPDINRLNPNDIENITILKGANAAALYGSEGVNGALIISTKKGRKGKMKIHYSNSTLFESISRLPEQQNQFGNGLNGIYDPRQYQSWGPRFDDSLRAIGSELPDGSQWILPYRAAEEGRSAFFNTGINTQNDLSISGGEQRTSYFLSVQDVRIKGIVPGDENTRTGIRLNTTHHFTDKLSTSFNLNYVFNNNDVTPSEPWANVYRMPANIPVSDLRDWRNTLYANPDFYFSNTQPNPFFNTENQRTVTKQQTLNGKLEIEYKATDWLKFIYRAGLYATYSDTRATVGKFTYSSPGRTNIAGSINDISSNFMRLNSDLILHAEKTFNKFSTRLVLGNNIRDDQSKTMNLSAAALVVPDLFNQDNRTGQLAGKSALSDYRQVAWYGEFTGGYDNFLFLTLTGRQESVSVLSKENRSYFYPGASLSFVFTDAFKGLKHSNILNFGKAYVSYNKTANVSIAPYQLQQVYNQNLGFPYGNQAGFSPAEVNANPNLRPEFVRTMEAGLQLSFLKNRLNLEAAYVISKTSDGIIQADISAATGYTSAWVNAFAISNNILEVDLNGDIIRSNDVRWTLGGNFTWINSEVTEIYGDIDRLYHFRQNYLIVGAPYNTFLFTDYKRDPEGRIIVDAKTGNPVGTAELYNGGTGTPPFQLGFHTSFEYKGLRIGAQFDWRLGAVVYSEAANRMIADGTSPLTVQYDRHPFVIPNSSIEVTAPVYDEQGNIMIPGEYAENTDVMTQGDRNYWANYVAPVQSNYAVSANFFKLRELSIGYTFPSSIIGEKKFLKELSVNLIGRNLFSIWAKDNIYNDPEFVYAGGSSEGYLSWRHLPATRMIGFNVNIGL